MPGRPRSGAGGTWERQNCPRGSGGGGGGGGNLRWGDDASTVPELLRRGAWEGSQLPVPPPSPVSSYPEKGFSAAEPCQLRDVGKSAVFRLPPSLTLPLVLVLVKVLVKAGMG